MFLFLAELLLSRRCLPWNFQKWEAESHVRYWLLATLAGRYQQTLWDFVSQQMFCDFVSFRVGSGDFDTASCFVLWWANDWFGNWAAVQQLTFWGVSWSDLKWPEKSKDSVMAEAEITVPDVCFQTFPWKKKCQVIVKYMKALCRYEHRLHRLHSWAPIPWTPHVRPLRWKGKRVRRWLSSHLSINLPHKLGTRELSWWVILIHFIHHDIGLSRAFLGLPSLWSIALPHWWTHCLFWSDLEIDRILRKHWLYNAWPYNASWLCHETVPCCKII